MLIVAHSRGLHCFMGLFFIPCQQDYVIGWSIHAILMKMISPQHLEGISLNLAQTFIFCVAGLKMCEAHIFNICMFVQ